MVGLVIMKRRLLIMESNPKIQDILSFAIGREGYEIIQASDGLDGLSLLETQTVDLIILDLAPPMDSIETCRCLREEGVVTPILLLTKGTGVADSQSYKDTDYLKKPFAMKELLAKIKDKTINSKIVYSTVPIPSMQRKLGRIVIDPHRSVILKDGIPLKLSQRDYDLLVYMSHNPGKVFSREELLSEVWGYSYIGDVRQVNVAIHRLRKGIEDDPAHPCIIMTKHKFGYYLSL